MPINKIIPFSCIDGPGNRMVIFFQGCNFKCGYCHNPETINLCRGCGECVNVCQTHALTFAQGRVLWDEKSCIGCDDCIRSCCYLSSPKTKNYTVLELMEQIKKAEVFIDGITVSGGECTCSADFLVALFRAVKMETTLTCFVDTNGGIDLSEMTDLVSLTDGFMLDVKAVEEEEHRNLTGKTNETVLKNLRFLLKTGKLYEVRTVLAPGLSHEKTIECVAKEIQDACIYKLLKYRPFGVRKEGLETFGTLTTNKDYTKEMLSLAKACGALKAMEI